jgi:heptosyltransferase-3
MIEPDARVLVIAVARIGDTVLATPILRAIRAAVPRGRVDVIVQASRKELLEGLPFVDRVIGARKARAAVARLAGRRYDYAFAFGHDRWLVEYALAVADKVVAFRQPDEDLNRRLFRSVDPPASPEHAVVERMRLARAAGIELADVRTAYVVTPEEAAQAEQFLRQAFAAPPVPLVAILPKSFPTKAYRDWPRARFADFLARLFAEFPGGGALVLGDEDARDVAEALVARFPGRVASAAGSRSLRQTAALIAACDLYVGVDTGPTHLAGALGVPMVVLYHCRHRGRFLAPLGHPALEVIEHPAPDDACSDATSMDAIGVDDVWSAARRLLARTRREETAA